ncbi:MAG: hypothetical protein COT71_00780 [Candidatus Andersenbacteria bacterium CG10_big_fil_rev_8_21_14_0_10_54_11]|uniref:DNA replication and repair protein RecF n=1 Tax=Candidatus Andersenbacteria bacterium CG10_big_fil_rev_8_21_14_0_10_54_11 TaxID=1974485 RepID=A0A2M6X021_9BACT|nr:MAG: hypothetical protein COT71_00780 [Candidatus Andersenbacteria bacterium CG10_big_fil_rev_8_21_14_0_10_54_11]
MRLERLGLSHFRNLGGESEFELPPQGLLAAVAPNAAGKTNFLESIAVLLRGKSFRAPLAACVAWGQPGFMVWGDVTGSETSRVAVRYQADGGKLRIEEEGEVVSLLPFYARYPYVLFVPEDTFLFSRGPAGRRSFLNQMLVAHTSYLAALVQYYRVLRQRNQALKSARSAEAVGVWTELLAEHAAEVWRFRRGAVQFFAGRTEALYQELTGERRELSVRWQPGAQAPEAFTDELDRQFSASVRAGHTLTGPHRDDFIILTDGRPVAAVLSRGQLRGLALALKVLTYQYLVQVCKREPLVLLDDALSELDETRGAALLNHLPAAAQIFLTCTRLPRALARADSVFALDLRRLITVPNRERAAA